MFECLCSFYLFDMNCTNLILNRDKHLRYPCLNPSKDASWRTWTVIDSVAFVFVLNLLCREQGQYPGVLFKRLESNSLWKSVQVEGYGEVWVISPDWANVEVSGNGFTLHGNSRMYFASRPTDGFEADAYWQVQTFTIYTSNKAPGSQNHHIKPAEFAVVLRSLFTKPWGLQHFDSFFS